MRISDWSSDVCSSDLAGRGLRAAVNVFYYKMDDIIRFAAAGGGTSVTAQNTGRQTGYGQEAELAWQAARRLRLSGNFASSEERRVGKRGGSTCRFRGSP